MSKVKLGDFVRVNEEFRNEFDQSTLKGYDFSVFEYELIKDDEIEVMLLQNQGDKLYSISVFGTPEEIDEMFEVIPEI